MYIFKNAWISITRNKGRNILMAVIIIVISCASAITLAILNSANSLIDSYQNQYEITGSISFNREAMMKNFDPTTSNRDEMIQNFQNIQNLTIEEIQKYGESSYVKNYYYTNSIGLNSSNIEKATTTMSNTDNNFKTEVRNNMQRPDQTSSADFLLTGYSNLQAMAEFVEGKYKITSGEISSDFTGNNCIINSELATFNGLSVGDTIIFTNPNDESKTYSLIITGIYEQLESDNTSNNMNLFSESVNTIFTNTNAINNIAAGDETINITANPTYILVSSDVIEAFEQELTQKGLSDNFSFTTNLEQVENATSSIVSLKTFSLTFLVITLVIGTIILIVINMINIRERKYEIGVLRTIGMKKANLTLQFLTEFFIITLVGLLIGASIGAFASVPTANMLLANEISSSQEQLENVNQNFGGNMNFDNRDNSQMKNNNKMNGVVQVEQVKSIHAIVDFKVLLELLVIGIGLTLISSLVSMISIQRFSPLTILKERS